jgi:hypothetical protein
LGGKESLGSRRRERMTGGSISQKKQTRREGTQEERRRLFYDRRDVNIMKCTVSHTSKKRKMGET